jgi:DNA-directed RNA polymerase subunit RPC12/RpoP
MYCYDCPNCGAKLELPNRVRATVHSCLDCSAPITLQEIDRQLDERRAAEQKKRQRHLSLGCGALLLITVAYVIGMQYVPRSKFWESVFMGVFIMWSVFFLTYFNKHTKE